VIKLLMELNREEGIPTSAAFQLVLR